MKLLFCTACKDVIALLGKERSCHCGASYGAYQTSLLAYYRGPCIPLGFQNDSFLAALENYPFEADRGVDFKAFVIPSNAPTIDHKND